MAAAIGIDLGTTNSCLAVCRDGKPEVIPAPDGGRTTPSVISYGDDGERLIGRAARRQSILYPQQTVQSIKRLIGRRADELEHDGGAGRGLIIEESSEGAARVVVGGRSRSPEEISAVILRQLRADAERWLGEAVSDAVITVPAYFNDAQRQATKDAGAIAGLNVLRIINEPTAAALAYGLGDSEREQTVLVFDLGGGTLDVSILTIADDVFDVMATAGDNTLGGDDFDRVIADWLFSEMASDGVELPDNQGQLQARIFEAAERAKCDLSSAVETTISLPFLLARDNEPYHLERTLSRAKFEGLVEPLLERAIVPLQQALTDAQIEAADLDQVLLVGGMTRMPLVQRRVAEVTGREPAQSVNPDEVVAMGAAIQADILSGESTHDLLLVDVTPLTLGIETRGGLVAPLIPRNNAIPARYAEVFTTAEDAQPSVEVHVVQGERPMANDCRSLGRLNLYGIPPQPRGAPQIQVAFEIDQNGILQVTARDLVSGQANALRIEGSSGLSADELSSLISEAENEAEGDRLRRRRAEAKNTAEALLYQAERALDAAPEADASIRESLAEEILTLRELLEGETLDEDALRERGELLIEAATALANSEARRTARGSSARPADKQTGDSGPEVIVIEAEAIVIEGDERQ